MVSVDFLHFLDIYTFHHETNVTLQNCCGEISFYAGYCMFRISISQFGGWKWHNTRRSCVTWHSCPFLLDENIFVGWKWCVKKRTPPKKQQQQNTIAKTKQINSEIFCRNKDLSKSFSDAYQCSRAKKCAKKQVFFLFCFSRKVFKIDLCYFCRALTVMLLVHPVTGDAQRFSWGLLTNKPWFWTSWCHSCRVETPCKLFC